MRAIVTLTIVLLVGAAIACSRGRRYELRGQIIAVDRGRQEITITHDDIRGFMPGMTMPFAVRDRSLLEGRTPGDLITATLVVEDNSGYLARIERTGRAPLPAAAPPLARYDLLNPGDRVPDAELVDQNGRTRRLADWRGQAVAVTFIYTRCPLHDFCPLMDTRFAEVQRVAGADPLLAGRFHLLSVSFDPDFDTPAVLADHAKRTGADPAVWTFASGTADAVDRFASRFGVSIVRNDSAPGTIVHNLGTAVIGGDGSLIRVFSGNEWTTGELIEALRSSVAER